MYLVKGNVPCTEVIVASVQRKRGKSTRTVMGVRVVVSEARRHGIKIRKAVVSADCVLLHVLHAAVDREIVIRLGKRAGTDRYNIRVRIESIDGLRHRVDAVRRNNVAGKRSA